MLTPALTKLSDIATAAHTKIQQDFPNINPVVGVNQGMRASGFPADVMTIDCLQTNRRIILILHDETPELVQYQFAFRDRDPSDDFADIPLEQLSVQTLYSWVTEYFSRNTTH